MLNEKAKKSRGRIWDGKKKTHLLCENIPWPVSALGMLSIFRIYTNRT